MLIFDFYFSVQIILNITYHCPHIAKLKARTQKERAICQVNQLKRMEQGLKP